MIVLEEEMQTRFEENYDNLIARDRAKMKRARDNYQLRHGDDVLERRRKKYPTTLRKQELLCAGRSPAVVALMDRVVSKVKSRAHARWAVMSRYWKDPEIVKQRVSDWRHRNVFEWREKVRKRALERYHNDVQYNIRDRCRSRLYGALKMRKLDKSGSVTSMIGCSLEELEQSMQSRCPKGYTVLELSIDHIFPLALYNLEDEVQIKRAMHWSNLRPMVLEGANGNASKGSSLPSLEDAMLVEQDCWPDDITEDMLE